MEAESEIDIFLQKVKLTKYKKKFKEQGPLFVSKITDFNRFLQDPNILREAGMTVFETNRFQRLCEKTIMEFCENPTIDTEDIKSKEITKVPIECPEIETAYAPELQKTQIRLRYKILTKNSIIRNSPTSFTIATSMLYYELVDYISKLVNIEIVGINFQSVELFSNTGYPLAISPKMYVKPLSEWNLEKNELIFVFPKRTPNCKFPERVTVIEIPIENTEIKIQIDIHGRRLFYYDLKILISRKLHLHLDSIIIKTFHVEKNKITIYDDRTELDINEVERNLIIIFIKILDVWGDGSYLGAFASELYTSYIDQIMYDWHHFNALLLFLAKEQSEINRYKLLEKLGLIRKLSCSPPLVYALYRLCTGLQITLPHRVAINEGILTTLSLLLPDEDPPKIHRFCELWMYVERNASSEYKNTEIYENNYISKSTRDNPKNQETKRLIHVFPESENSIVTWKDCPSAHEPFSCKTLKIFNISQDQINRRFRLRHPIELYLEFLSNGLKYGLVRAEIHNLSSPTVFLGPTIGRYGYFDYYSPEKGKCESHNPHDMIRNEKCSINYSICPSKIIIIVDISDDMSFGCLEYKHGRDSNEPNIVLSHLEMGIFLIELLIDNVTGLGCGYPVEIILVSNNHEFPNGFHELQAPTLEYGYSLNKLKKFIRENNPKNEIFRRSPNGIIVNCLNHLLNKYPPGQQIYIFTNHDYDKKIYGAKTNQVVAKLKQKRFKTNFIVLSEGSPQIMSHISNESQGIYIDKKVINSNLRYQTSPHFPPTINEIPAHYIIEYHSQIQDKMYLKKEMFSYGSFPCITSKFRKTLVSINSILSKSQSEKSKYSLPNAIHILKQISNYSKNPNPFCKLFSVANQIQTLISIIQGPDNTPYANSVLFLEIKFTNDFPQKPPQVRFLSSYYHPNIRVSGEVCHPILFEDYRSGVTLKQILDSIYNMLYTPVISHAVRYKVLEIALFYKDLYRKLVTSFIKVFNFDTLMSGSLKCLNIEESIKQLHPEPYICPLTKELFDLPVMTPEGNTYERHAILQHLKFSQTDPFTNSPLTESDLIPNNPVMSAVYKYRKKYCSKTYWWD